MLTGQQQKLLRQAIIERFLPDDLKSFLEYELDKKWHLITSSSKKFPDQIFELIQASNLGRWYGDLVLALNRQVPDENVFSMLAFELKLDTISYDGDISAPVDLGALQAMVNDDPMFDINVFVMGMLDAKKCVCRIELINGERTVFGTGFLVGPDMVLTNYHVVEQLFKAGADQMQASCRFDFEVLADGTLSAVGNNYVFSVNSILKYSEYAQADVKGSADINDPSWTLDRLDYALIKLDAKVGDQELPLLELLKKDITAKRGWIRPSDRSASPYSKNIFIIQHPKGQPMKIAFGLGKSGVLSKNGTRLRYKVNTMHGSSGSPGFDENFNWIALHNIGDPDWQPAFNQGVTAWSIINDLRNKGVNL